MITLNYTLFGTVFINVCEYVGIFMRYYNYDNGLYEKKRILAKIIEKQILSYESYQKKILCWISISIKIIKEIFFYFKNSLIWCYPEHHQTQYNLVRLFIRNSTKRLIILWINSQYSPEQINTIRRKLVSTVRRTKRALNVLF